MLDTDTCIDLIRTGNPRILSRLQSCEIGEVGISAISLAKLNHGVEKSANRDRNQIALQEFHALFEIVWFDDRAALHYGKIRAQLEREGKVIGPMDLLIAASALADDAVIVTKKEREFRRVDGLRVENWA